MIVKFVDFKKSYKEIENEVLPEIKRVLENGDYILREDVIKFEKNLAKYVGSEYAVGLNSGTDALFLSLKALGIGKGDEVITSGYTFWATVEAIINCGATPVLADIGVDLLIDPKDIAKKITPNTKAIIPVHIGGAVCDMEAIKGFGIPIIEDSAQSLGAMKNPVGDIQTYSFYPAKILGGYGDGGMITTNDKKIADKIRLLRNHGGKPHPKLVGFNARLDNLQATILNVRLKYLSNLIKRRREIAKIYDKNLPCAYTPKSQTYQEYNLRVYKRDKLFTFLKENGIETIKGDYTFPMEVPEECKMANRVILRLPIWPTISDEQILYVCEKIKYFYAN